MAAEDYLTRIPEYIEYQEVDVGKLYTDPNNPRFKSQWETKIPESRYIEDNIRKKTRDLMMDRKNKFDIPGMMNDFLVKGFVDGDEIIVKKFDEQKELYLVLEGNRRITAIKELLSEERREATEEARPGLVKELSTLPVTEIVQKDLTDEQFDRVVDQMLGIRHLNQLKEWSPFARGQLMHEEYLNIEPKMTKESFMWEEDEFGNCKRAEEVATKYLEQISPALKDMLPRGKRKVNQDGVKDYIRTVRVMEQLSAIDDIVIKDQYYSLFEEFTCKASKQLRDFIPIDEQTFNLEAEEIKKVITLCALKNITPKKRSDAAPINNPAQWRNLSWILDPEENPSPEEIESMKNEVLLEGKKPSEVKAKRISQRQSFTWDQWIDELRTLIIPVKFSDVPKGDPKTQEALAKMWEVLDTLSKHGGKNEPV